MDIPFILTFAICFVVPKNSNSMSLAKLTRHSSSGEIP